MESDSNQYEMEDEMVGFIDEAKIQEGFLEDKMDEVDNPRLIEKFKIFIAQISSDWLLQVTV
jgi:hypothetical protein